MNLKPDYKRMFAKVQYVTNGMTRIFYISIGVEVSVSPSEIAVKKEPPKIRRRLYDRVKYCVECVIRNLGPLVFVWGILFGM